MLLTENLLKAVALKRLLTRGVYALKTAIIGVTCRLTVKAQLIAIVAAVVLMGCGK
jgi:hypothetical protein